LRAAGPFHTDRENGKGELFSGAVIVQKMLSFMMKLLKTNLSFILVLKICRIKPNIERRNLFNTEKMKKQFFWCCNYAKMLSFMMKLLENKLKCYSSAQKYSELSQNMERRNLLHTEKMKK
jgi:hypothetical protein